MASTVKLSFIIDDQGTVRVIEDAGKAIEGVGKKAKESESRINDLGSAAERGFERMRSAAVSTIAATGAAAVAFGGYAVAQAAEFEKLEVRLQGITGSAEEARRKMAQAIETASRTPFQVAQVVEAQAVLAAFGETSNKTLVGVADLAAFMQRDIVEAAGAFGRAIAGGAGAADIFRENGILAIVKANQELKGDFRELTELSLPEFREALLDTLSGDKIQGSADRLSKTFTGLVSNIGDAFQRFAAEVGKVAIESDKVRDSGEKIIDTLDRLRIAAGDPAFRRAIEDIASFASTAAVSLASLGQEALAQVTALGLYQQGEIGIFDLAGAYGSKITGLGLDSSFTDLVREYYARQIKDFSDTGDAANDLLNAISQANNYFAKIGEELTTGGGGGGTGGGGGAGGGAAAATKQIADEFGRINELAKLTPVELMSVTSEIEAAQVAAVNLGDVLSDSLVSAVDSLIAGGSFDLGDVLEATGKSAMSRMVGAMIKEKLGFDAVFKANFLEYLPGIASQGADLISQNFGLGLRSIASQSANAGQVVAGGLTVTGGPFGAGMSTAADTAFMTDAATGQAVAVAGPSLSQGVAPAAAGAGGIGAGLLGGLALAGPLIGGGIGVQLAKSGIFGDRAANNPGLFGLGTAAAIAAPFTLGLAPLAVALFGKRPPSAQELRRMAIGDAYREVGLFPSLAFAKNPGSTFRDAPIPGFIDGMSPELSALSLLYGGTTNDAFGRIQGTIGSRASVLGLSEEQARREIRTVAGASGVSLGTAVGDLNTRFLEAQINNKGDLSPSQYRDLVTGTISILSEDLPAGVDAATIAFEKMERVGGFAVVELQAFGEELERQKNLATTLQGGVAGAGQSAITALLTGGDPAAAFRSGLLNAAAGGISSQLVGTLFADGGPLGAALTEAVLGGDPDALGAAIASAGDSLEMLTSAAEKFVPVLASLIDVVEDGTDTAVDRSGYLSQRNDLRSRIEQARFSMLSPGAQEDFILRQLDANSGYLRNLAADRVISEAELPDFDYASGNLVNYGFAALSAANNYAGGSRQQRQLQQAGLNALELAESGLSLAAEVATMRDVTVTRMVVQSVEFSQSAALSMHGG